MQKCPSDECSGLIHVTQQIEGVNVVYRVHTTKQGVKQNPVYKAVYNFECHSAVFTTEQGNKTHWSVSQACESEADVRQESNRKGQKGATR